jgi:hypothetical protein
MFVAFDELLRPVMPYAIASWSTHDPATGLFTSCTMSGVRKNPENEAHLFRCEFRQGEPSSYRSLIGSGSQAAILSTATEGDLDRASRHREIFAPAGLTDELRAVLWVDATAWGSATLLRTGADSTAVTWSRSQPSAATSRTGSGSPSSAAPRADRRGSKNHPESSR